MERKKAAFAAIGCKVNAYDTEAMRELFEKRGYEIVDFTDFADVYIVNTCTVTNMADKKSRQMLRRARTANPGAVVVAAGCYTQTQPEEVQSIDGINIIIGTKNKNEIVDIVENYYNSAGKQRINAVTDIMHEKEYEEAAVIGLKNHTRAYVKIQDGCNMYCTYCIIPYARGPVRSRNPEEILSEVKNLAQKGFKEAVLTGIHVASYGIDLNGIDFVDIIRLIHDVDGIERIRLSSFEPTAATDRFIEALMSLPKLCPHFHLSLQSGCDNTLKRMNRHYTTQMYASAVERLRAAFPDLAITTDIIAGFPGETDADFKESLDFAANVGLFKIHAFAYSPKRGTPAAKYPGQIPADIKNARVKELMELSRSINKKYMEQYIGKVMPVLFERIDADGLLEGYTTNYMNIHVKGGSELKNKIVPVKIQDVIKELNAHGVIEKW